VRVPFLTLYKKKKKLIFQTFVLIGPYSPTPVKVNCRLKCFVTLVTYCYNNIFVYFNLQLTLTGVGEYGPENDNF
jgi:hypothetical protein